MIFVWKILSQLILFTLNVFCGGGVDLACAAAWTWCIFIMSNTDDKISVEYLLQWTSSDGVPRFAEWVNRDKEQRRSALKEAVKRLVAAGLQYTADFSASCTIDALRELLKDLEFSFVVATLLHDAFVAPLQKTQVRLWCSADTGSSSLTHASFSVPAPSLFLRLLCLHGFCLLCFLCPVYVFSWLKAKQR
jgi:hypothetical protein